MEVSNIDMWQVIIGVLLPLIIAWANRIPIPNYLIAFGLCFIAAFGDVWFTGKWDAANMAQSLLTIFFLVVTSYKGFWQPSGITDKIEGKK